MKTLLIVLLGAVSASAQTNVINFTNKAGEIINGEVFKVDAVRIIYKTGGSDFHSIKLSEMPITLQSRFGYDPEKERQAINEEKANQAKAAERRAAIQTQKNAAKAIQDLEKSVEDSRTVIWARVIQRIGDNKLLIDADSVVQDYNRSNDRPWINGDHWESEGLPQVENDRWHSTHNIATGTVLLTEYKKTTSTFDGQKFAIIAFPIGTYKYTTAMGSEKIVEHYTASLELAVKFAFTNQSN